MPSPESTSPSSASGVKLDVSAASAVGPAEHAALRRASDRDAHARGVFRHEHPHERKPRGGLLELLVAGRFGHGESHLGDDLALFERRGEHAVKEVIRRDLPGIRHHRGARRQHRRRIAGGRVVIGKAAADGAAIAHRRIADICGQRRERRIGPGACRHIRVGGAATDTERAIIGGSDALDLGHPRQAYQPRGRGQTLFQRRNERLPAAQRLRVLGPERLDRIGQCRGAVYFECIHDRSPYPCIACQTRDGDSGMSIWAMSWPPDCSASMTALTTAGGLPMAPASPQPFTPSGLWVQGVWQE